MSVAADLTVEREVDDAVSAAAERFGRIDALFNVAGGSGRRFGDGPIHEMTADGWDRTLALNVRTHVRRVARWCAGCWTRRRTARAARCDPAMASVLARIRRRRFPDPRLRRGQGRDVRA